MMRKYGFTVSGSKELLAERIVAALPPGRVLVDLFAGGCSVTHCALLSGKWQEVIANDLRGTAILFRDLIEGRRTVDVGAWVTREQFYATRDSDMLTQCAWSFGNQGISYFCTPDKEAMNKAAHECVAAPTIEERAIARGKMLREVRRLGINHESVGRAAELLSVKRLEGKAGEICAKSKLTATQSDYRELPIPDDAVIYCDPPYRGTKKCGAVPRFDSAAFLEWARERTQPTYISEYRNEMPERFETVASWEKRCHITAYGSPKKVTELLLRRKEV